MRKPFHLGIIFISIVIIAYGFLAPSSYFLHIVIMMSIWAIVSSSLNLLLGYTGLLNLGHAGIVGIGAYTSAILTLKLGMSPWATLPIASILAASMGFLIGILSLRTKGISFAIITMMFGIMLYIIFESWTDVTGGFLGLYGIPRPSFLTINFKLAIVNYFFVMAIFLLIILFFYRLVNSRIGRIFISIREDEDLATVLGVDIRKYKILSFVIACFIAGMAGWLYAHYVTYVSPSAFSFGFSFELLIYSLFGGVGTILGPILGTFLLRGIYEYFIFLATYRIIISCLIVVFMMKYMPEGFYPAIKTKIKSIFRSHK